MPFYLNHRAHKAINTEYLLSTYKMATLTSFLMHSDAISIIVTVVVVRPTAVMDLWCV